jgi:hypothetical protein
MAPRVTNQDLKDRIDRLSESFKEFRLEIKGTCEGLNGRQRNLMDRVTKLETKENPEKERETSRLEDPKVLLALVGVIQALVGLVIILIQQQV